MNNRIFAKNRRDQLIVLLQEQQAMSTQQLAELMQVSSITVRRDLDQLESEGFIERVHGGAVLVRSDELSGADELPYQIKIRIAKEEKQNIAKRAALEVTRRSVVILDSGTSCLALAKQLAGQDITIIALDLQVAQAAAVGMTQVHLLGGLVRNGLCSLVGPWALELLQRLHAEVFFLGADAVTPDGITNSMIEEAEIKRMAVAQSQRTILLADHTKINRRSLAGVVSLAKIDLWITDTQASPLLEPYRAAVRIETV